MKFAYSLLLEGKVSDNLNKVITEHTSLVNDIDTYVKEPYSKKFKKLAESVQLDCTDIEKAMSVIDHEIDQIAHIVQEATQAESLKRKNDKLKKAYRLIQECRERESELVRLFSKKVNQMKQISESVT